MSHTRRRTAICLGIALLVAQSVMFGCASRHSGELARTATETHTGFLFRSATTSSDKGETETLPYVVFVPRSYTPETSWPAIVFLHGSGESGTDGQKQIAQGIGTNILWNASRWPCIVIMPQKPTSAKLWDQHDAGVMAALEATKREFNVDSRRIALTGLSQGGHGVWALGAKHPAVWCALAPICGFVDSNRASGDAATIAAAIRDIPVWCFHGDADDVVLPSQTLRMADELRKLGATPGVSIYPGVNHGSWDKAYAEAELPAFLMKSR